METVKDRIQALCDRKGISISCLEKELGIGSKTISRWDKFMPNTRQLVMVAEYFDVTTDYLLGRETTTIEEKLEEMAKSEEMKILFDTTRDCTLDQLRTVAEMVKLWKKTSW